MESNVSRSAERAERVRLNDVVVEFTAGGADECFEAEAINVSSGGVALRSPLLPEVGTRLACRFPNPVDGALISAECEVVWSCDQGPNLGEFGLRFEKMSAESAESIRKLVDEEDRMLTDEEARELGWGAARPAPIDSESEVADDDLIALSLDGVASELIAEVRHESEDVLVAEQELPFLRLGTRVSTETGRSGVLQTVEIRIEDDLPRLVFTIVYDEDAPAIEASADASSEAYEPEMVLHAEGRHTVELEDPEAFAAARLDEDVRGFALDEIEPARDGSLEDDTIPDDLLLHSTYERARPRLSEQVRAVGEPVVDRASEVAGAVRDATVERFQAAIPAVRSKLDDARESMTAVAADITPKMKDSMRELAARTSRFTTLLSKKLRNEAQAHSSSSAAPKKRVQRRPDELRTTAPSPVVNEERTIRGRHLLVGALALLVVVLGIRGIMRAMADEPAALVPPRAASSFEEDALDTSAIDAPPPVAAPAVATPEPTGGSLPAPTFPSVDRASDIPAATASAPTSRKLDFGASSVPGGMPFELTMTTPIDRIEGEATESGFTVRVFRSNSLSRAGPIAQQHTAVDRAAVTNEGENAVLMIAFKPGRRPPYRVEAVGSRLRILLGH